MEKRITLKEFKEAKASLIERIVDLVREELIDFHEKTGVKARGNVSFDWREMPVYDVSERRKVLGRRRVLGVVEGCDVECNLKTDLE